MSVSDASPLRVPRYRALWVASVFSNMGSFFQTVAASWLMKNLTDSSATWVGLMVASNMLPLLFLALLSGVVADSFDRAKVMLASQIAMGSGAAAMAILARGRRDHPGPPPGARVVDGRGDGLQPSGVAIARAGPGPEGDARQCRRPQLCRIQRRPGDRSGVGRSDPGNGRSRPRIRTERGLLPRCDRGELGAGPASRDTDTRPNIDHHRHLTVDSFRPLHAFVPAAARTGLAVRTHVGIRPICTSEPNVRTGRR